MWTEHRYESFPVLQKALLDWSQSLLQQALQAQQNISVLLSGGTTPLPWYRELAQAELPWERIHLALVDERWVDVDAPLSNERTVKAAFAANPYALRNFTGMKTLATSAAAAVQECNARYAELPWPPALCVLGLGADGHTASLFPGATGLPAALDAQTFCVPIQAQSSEVTGDCTERMTLTPWALLQSRHTALVFTGQPKWQVYQNIIQREDVHLPASLILHNAATLDVFWCPA